jgi:hypothetical protein
MIMEKVTIEDVQCAAAKYWSTVNSEMGGSLEVYEKARGVFNQAQEDYQRALRAAVEAAYVAKEAARLLKGAAGQIIDPEDQCVAESREQRVSKVWKYLDEIHDREYDKAVREEFRAEVDLYNSDNVMYQDCDEG